MTCCAVSVRHCKRSLSRLMSLFLTTGATWWPCSTSSGPSSTKATRNAARTCTGTSRPTIAGSSLPLHANGRLQKSKKPWLDLLSSQEWRRQYTAQDPYQATILLMLPGLTLAAGTPPLPDVDRLRCALRTGVVVMYSELVHGDVRRTVQRHKWKLRQVDLVFLVEDLLPRIEVRCRMLLDEQLIHGRVAVEVVIHAVRWELIAGEQRGIIAIIGVVILELEYIIPACHRSGGRRRVAATQEGAKERTGRIVLDVDLDANRAKFRLQDQLVIGTPQVVGRRRVLELQPHSSLGAHAVCPLDPAVLIQQCI